jgi:hypothetical protein
MSVKGAIHELLSADPTVTGFVGARIFTNTAEEGVLSPYIVIDEAAGGQNSPSTLTQSNVTVRSYNVGTNALGGAKTVQQIGFAVYAVLDKYSGVNDTTDIRGVLIADENDQYINPTEGESIGTHVREQRWNVFYTRIRSLP